MSNEPERAEPVLSPEDRPPEALFEDYVECALDPQGAAAAVVALRARLDAAEEVLERMRVRSEQEGPNGTVTESVAIGCAGHWHDALAAALGGSDSPTGHDRGER